ncbi:hypothetical protein ABCV69_004501 [Pseudomonas aeruginosa]|nr:hypothetical protein [[Pseudomonas] sp. BICA1-14]KJS79047.1 MAG: hypothetical protein JL55_13585 [[Pseudomonas] sp. BICA1-14]HBN9859408.1 hypothetical protein [Pseudomonas aeruginosa]HBO8078196.1 hypothetical protein [Pseudomonas aeruginosa]HBO8799794.1 hypothetical protein [Pseudomonas aeruginosa]
MFPKEIKAERQLLEGGRFAFNLRHDTLGELGRIVLQTAQLGGSHVSYEVIDLPDGSFDQRKAMMESLAKIVTEAFAKARR